MTAYLAILRGVNVGGHGRIKMAELERVFWALGHTDVVTFIQSGNVVFASPSNSTSELVTDIEQQLEAKLGLQVTVIVRSRDQLAAVIRDNPFLGKGEDPDKVHVTFLAGAPSRALDPKLDLQAFSPDEFVVRAREVYLHCPLGYGRTKVNNSFWERRLGVAATTRNWNTAKKLMELLNAVD
jgi:uncharacterized protein (DUF1697 family)